MVRSTSERWREGMATMEALNSLSIGPQRSVAGDEKPWPGNSLQTAQLASLNPFCANSIDTNHAQQFEIAQHFSGAQHDGSERVIGDGNRQAGFFTDALVQIFQKSAATGEHDTAVADVRGELRRSAFESHADRVHNRCHAFTERFANFAVVNGDGTGNSLNQVAA